MHYLIKLALTPSLSIANYVLLKLFHLLCFLVCRLIFCQHDKAQLGLHFLQCVLLGFFVVHFTCTLLSFNMYVNVLGPDK